MIEGAERAVTVVERVDFCTDLMAREVWITRTTAKQLAAQWGISKTTVEHYACEASRRVRADRGTLDQVRDNQLAKLEMIVHQAIAKKEFRTAVSAIEAASKIAGTIAPQKHEIQGVLLGAAWVQLRGRIIEALAPFPDAREALLEVLAKTNEPAAAAELPPPSGPNT